MKYVVLILTLLIAAAANAQNYIATWDDIRSPFRKDAEMNSALKIDVEACNRKVGVLHGSPTVKYKQCMAQHDWKLSHVTKSSAPRSTSSTIIYNRDSPDPGIGWHWEGGMRTCHYDCNNPRIPGSGYTCKDIMYGGRPTTECVKKG